MIRLPSGTLLVINKISSISKINENCCDTGKFYIEIGCGGLLFVESDYDRRVLNALREGIINRVMNAS